MVEEESVDWNHVVRGSDL